MNPQATDGQWLEDLTVAVGSQIKEWDIALCYPWAEWPEREAHFPGTTNQDVGIDCVAVRRDGEHIAIQCKSRQLNASGQGTSISKSEIDSFASTSAGEFWAERWVVTNGDNPISNNALQAIAMTGKPVKMVNIANDLLQQQAAFTHEECPHCDPNPDDEERQQTRTCMQAEAIAESIRILREHELSNSGGLPMGQARGKIILPCGTGKTRISLRIVEKLTPQGQLSIVLCPSIALVAQIRREYLQHAETDIRPLAVCSDQTAGYNPRNESSRNTAIDPTLDNSNVSASEVKGKVTTLPAEITQWIRDGQETNQVSVIFGTYQSGHRIAEALSETGITAKVLIADEAHRTAGLRRKRNARNGTLTEEEQRIRDFTLCHDNSAFPATYRIYQTATPRIYDTNKVNQDQSSNWIVRTMDDETIFGVELYRKSYVEAVRNRWLSDYRIIAVGISGPDTQNIANQLAGETKSKGRHALTTTHFLRGLAFVLAMGGATQNRENGNIPIKSCIAFMNTVDKSQNMVEGLQTTAVRKWLQDWLHDNQDGQPAAQYKLEHLDATSKVTARDNAKHRLAEASETNPHGIINVGIFGEGTDAPSLNAVAFLEARKSPIDVIQAVGRAMRISPGKEMGYIICPIVIPPNADPEQWLSTSNKEEGWQELGQILLALRAHDQRIEDNLEALLHLYVPKPPDQIGTIIAIANQEEKRIQYREHDGPPREAEEAVERVLENKSTLAREFHPISEPVQITPQAKKNSKAMESLFQHSKPEEGATREIPQAQETKPDTQIEPTQIVTGKKNDDGSTELRMDTVARTKPAPDGTRGPVDIKKSKAKAKGMINDGKGVRIKTREEKRRRQTREQIAENSTMQLLLMSGMEGPSNTIRTNLLSKSGLSENHVVRDLNILESSVKEAAHHLRNDELQPKLDKHFGIHNLREDHQQNQADGCTTAALLMMNAAMLHQRISDGGWLAGISGLSFIKNDVGVVARTRREWERIMRHDFRPVLEPAVEVIYTIEETGKLSGLERALRHLATEAEHIAETYADMGADHAGPLFNRVMGNQASDGAYFTKPAAASIAARLTMDACGDTDWTQANVWREHKIVDLACGSGTLLAAMLTNMKHRAREQGASETEVTDLQKLAVEETIKGMDINPVSLQLAASQLTAGNREIRYRQMGLHLMPYGPNKENPKRVLAGTLELLGQKAIVPRNEELEIEDDKIGSQTVWNQHEDADLEDAVDAARNARIVIMNPPFTNRSKTGEKFPKGTQQALRSRVDNMEKVLVRNDKDMEDFVDKNSIGPLFVALADCCVGKDKGIVTMIRPTIVLSTSSAQNERRLLANRYHIHTVLTCHQPNNFNLVQRSNINESIIVAKRHNGTKPSTRFINLDRLPANEAETEELHKYLTNCSKGSIPNGWGEISEWPAERIGDGDWTPAIWRSPILAKSSADLAERKEMPTMAQAGLLLSFTGRRISEFCKKSQENEATSFPVLYSAGADGQKTIQSAPDEYWEPQNSNDRKCLAGTKRLKEKAGYLLVTHSQGTDTARVTATASDEKLVGAAWMPVKGLSPQEAKTIAIFLNSTPGRLLLMRNPGRKLTFPTYSVAEAENIRIPDIKDDHIQEILADCWEYTKDMTVPQFRDGECEVRRLWDEAVAEAMEWDVEELARLRELLNKEPHVRGLGYNQYADEVSEPRFPEEKL